MSVKIHAVPWNEERSPKKILVIRLQALGDTVITLPYLLSVKQKYPEVQLDFLTRKEVSQIPENLSLFDRVIALGGGRNARLQFVLAMMMLPFLWTRQYDAVIDLQNNKITRILRKLLFPKAWSEFDKWSPLSAGERTRMTIEAIWHWKASLNTNLELRTPIDVNKLLIQNGWKKDFDLVVLNPAGYAPSRSWPLENYVMFANQWLKTVNSLTQFVLLLLPNHREKANYIKSELGEHCINLTGQADQLQALSIIRRSAFVLSEDSGLMHMAWVQGIPTIALFSSSRKDWAGPLGERSYCFDSSDLECGPCMKEVCQYGDNRCLTRYTPEIVLQKAMSLYGKK